MAVNGERIIKIIAWNAAGLTRDKTIEFGATLIDLQVDLALISESHFTIEDKRYIQGFKMYNARHPSNKNRGGASVIVKSNVKHSVVSVIEEEKFQAVVVEISSSMGNFNVAAVYSPPRHKISAQEYKTFLGRLGPRFLAGGDWNSKNLRWGSRITSIKGKHLEEAVDELGGGGFYFSR